jgi:predicted nucleotidyltransferase
MVDQEQIIRIVKSFGNGAHVFVPKEWAGEQILVIKPQKKRLKERIISELEPYLGSIVGVYLYGSYARDEQKEDSDIDLFIITNEKIKIKARGFEIVCLKQDEIEKAIKIEPLLMYSILSEAKVIINSKLLEEIKSNYKPKLKEFETFLKDTLRMIKVNEDFLKSEKSEVLFSEAIIYSLVLRLRGLFIVKSILREKKYSHRLFKDWIKSEISGIDFNSIYDAYRSSKNDEKIKQKLKVEDVRKLLKFLKNEVLTLENG